MNNDNTNNLPLPENTTDEQSLFAPDEIKNSKRIFKSATPKGTIDWYVKWASSIIILCAITVRASGVQELMWLDMLLSWIGACGWFVVSWLWKDRALILLNGVIGVMLFGGLINWFFGPA